MQYEHQAFLRNWNVGVVLEDAFVQYLLLLDQCGHEMNVASVFR